MSERERRRVSFSPSSGSTSSRYASDSGVASLSDHSSRGGYSSERSSASASRDDEWNDLPALQKAYTTLHNSKEHYKKQAKELEGTVKSLEKENKELDTKWRKVVERSNSIEADKNKYFEEKKSLNKRVASLEDTIETLRKQLADANLYIEQLRPRGSPPPPPADLATPGPSKLSRTPSKRGKDKEKERDKDRERVRERDHKGHAADKEKEKEKARLQQRFELNKEGDNRSDSTTSSKQSRRSATTRKPDTADAGSYVEPFGPSSQPPPSSVSSKAAPSSSHKSSKSTRIPPQSPNRAHYDAYAAPGYPPPLMSPTREATFGNVPRSVPAPVVHPAVYAEMSTYEQVPYVETGGYVPYALPKEPRGKHGR